MPVRFKDSVKQFKFQLCEDSGLPVGYVETIGNGRWILTCPLCSCAHDITTFKGAIYQPLCANGQHQQLWKIESAAWQRKYPDATRFKSVMLRAVEAAPTGESDTSDQEAIQAAAPLELVKPARKRQPRKKAA